MRIQENIDKFLEERGQQDQKDDPNFVKLIARVK
jgi:hypothetical protein